MMKTCTKTTSSINGSNSEVSVPLTRDSAVDSELLQLAREFPEDTNKYIHDLFDDECVVRYPRGKNVKKSKTFLHSNEPVFYGESTTKADYHSWGDRPNLVRYGDMPVLIDSIMFPQKAKNNQSEMRSSYQGEQTQRIPLMKGKDPNLRCEGLRDFITIQRDSYKPRDEPVERTKPIFISNNMTPTSKQPFFGETQFMHDFPRPKNHQPSRPAKPVQPTINLKMSNDPKKDYFMTENQAIYRGHNVKDHPIPEPFRKDPREYVRPTEEFATETVMMKDYQPMPLEAITAAIKKSDNQIFLQPGRVRAGEIKFQGNTTSGDAYKAYSSEELNRLRYGDMPPLIGSILFPSPEKNVKSVTQAAFLGEQTARIPLQKGMSSNLTLEGSHDFHTVQRDSYQPRDEPVPRVYPKEKENHGNVVIPSGNRTFYGLTSSKEFYKEWEPQHTKPIRNDLWGLEKKWSKPKATKSQDYLTETHKSFVPKSIERVENLKPVPVPIGNLGEQDFTTVHKKSYPAKMKYHLSKVQAELLKQQLKKKKAALGTCENSQRVITVH